jgi:hypothetical protein
MVPFLIITPPSSTQPSPFARKYTPSDVSTTGWGKESSFWGGPFKAMSSESLNLPASLPVLPLRFVSDLKLNSAFSYRNS